MALIAAILEAAGRDREDSEAEDGYTVLPTSEGVAVGLATAHHMTAERFPTFRTAWRGSVERLGVPAMVSSSKPKPILAPKLLGPLAPPTSRRSRC
jgi:hypothetical protein